MTITIAVDAMGGDHGPSVTVPAALKVVSEQADLRLILVGDETVLRETLAQCEGKIRAQIEIQHASQVVAMDELPSQALRNKKDSSMRVAINLVKQGSAQACVSAGNTGALMATARFVLKTLPGIDRPAIANALPAMKGHTLVLDLGANVDVTAEQLVQFAVMGAVLVEAVDGRQFPTVGLLNVGEEEIKGNEQVKEAAKLLASSALNYAGFVEGDDIYKGTVDVVVCDGFVGNVALKTSEGVAKMISHYMRQSFQRNWLTKAVGLLALPVLRDFRQRVDPGRYNGASLLGLNSIVIKSHGGADIDSFAWAIRGAVTEVVKSVPQRIGDRVASLLVERQAV